MRSLSFSLILGAAALGLLGFTPASARAQRFRSMLPPQTVVPRTMLPAQTVMPRTMVSPFTVTAAQRAHIDFAASSGLTRDLRNFSLARDLGLTPASLISPILSNRFNYPLYNPYAAMNYPSAYPLSSGYSWASMMGSGYSSPYMQAYGGSGGYGGYQQPTMANAAPQTQSTVAAPTLAETQSQGVPIVTVGVYDNAVEPKAMTISVGTTVRWKNNGEHLHTVTSDTGVWDSRELDPGKVYSYTFTRPGTYSYHCVLNPDNMRGKVVVQE